MHRRTLCIAALAFVAMASGAAVAQPSSYPLRAVALIVPYAPGGLPDTVARFIGQKLSDRWGVPVIIENKPGGNGVIAAQALAARPPDGYTLLVTDGSMFSINPHIYPNLPYDPQKDFTHISLVARAPLFLAVRPEFPAATFPEFVQLVRSNPGKFTYGSSGIGSIHHLTFETIKSILGLDILHVPYKGTGQSVPAVVGGDVTAVWSAMPSIGGFVKEGRLKLLAVNSEKRSALAPGLATVAETSIPGFDFAPIIGVSGPAGLKAAIVEKVSRDIADVLKDKAAVERLTVLGIDPVGSDPHTYEAQLAADRVRFERAVKVAGASSS